MSTATFSPIASGTELYKLIPQRPPIVMVDTLCSTTETSAETRLTVLQDNIFVDHGLLTESGIIEHVAQSAAAFKGYDFWLRGITPKIGYIAEMKKFHIDALPPVGSQLHTELTVLGCAGGMTLLNASVCCEGRELATGQMKIYMTGEE